VRNHLAEHTSVRAVRFITNYLLPPPKRAVLAHLGIPLATGEAVKDEDRIPIVRKAEVDVSRPPIYYNSLVDTALYVWTMPESAVRSIVQHSSLREMRHLRVLLLVPHVPRSGAASVRRFLVITSLSGTITRL
jgi:hypothetical protein